MIQLEQQVVGLIRSVLQKELMGIEYFSMYGFYTRAQNQQRKDKLAWMSD